MKSEPGTVIKELKATMKEATDYLLEGSMAEARLKMKYAKRLAWTLKNMRDREAKKAAEE